MSTVMILLAAWAAAIVATVIMWHRVMQHAHRQDVRPMSAATIPAQRRTESPTVARPR